MSIWENLSWKFSHVPPNSSKVTLDWSSEGVDGLGDSAASDGADDASVADASSLSAAAPEKQSFAESTKCKLSDKIQGRGDTDAEPLTLRSYEPVLCGWDWEDGAAMSAVLSVLDTEASTRLCSWLDSECTSVELEASCIQQNILVIQM